MQADPKNSGCPTPAESILEARAVYSMWDKVWDLFVGTMMTLFMPAVCSYFTIASDPFLTIAARDATGFEWVGNQLLTPVQYILVGKEAIQKEDGSWEFTPRFNHADRFWLKTATSGLAVVPSLVLGTTVKGLSLLTPTSRARHHSLVQALRSTRVDSHLTMYREWGLRVGEEAEPLVSQGYLRRPGDEEVLKAEKRGLKTIIELLNQAQIPCWVDCGTCLGAYRYGGVIPWDEDVDLAALLPDFQNVKRTLNQLNPKEYIVQDWSSRDYPDSLLKIYVRESGAMIDIYFFDIDLQTKELHYIFSLENNCFFPEWWKIRERRFKEPIAFDAVFPLRKALLDGIEVFVPYDTKKYLQRCYGENLDPAKIYDPTTCRYERDLSHPYWQRAYVH